MSRLPAPMVTEISSGTYSPCVLLDLQLASGMVHLWTGFGQVAYGSYSYQGIGQLGSLGDVNESLEVRAEGTSVTLSGIDPTLLADTLGDVQQGAPAVVSFALFSAGAISSVVVAFSGTVDQPSIEPGPDSFAITLALESRMTDLQRPTSRRYTASDQNQYYPTDYGFAWVEMLNDIALVWG